MISSGIIFQEDEITGKLQAFPHYLVLNGNDEDQVVKAYNIFDGGYNLGMSCWRLLKATFYDLVKHSNAFWELVAVDVSTDDRATFGKSRSRPIVRVLHVPFSKCVVDEKENLTYMPSTDSATLMHKSRFIQFTDLLLEDERVEGNEEILVKRAVERILPEDIDVVLATRAPDGQI